MNLSVKISKVRSHYCRTINSFLLLIYFLECLHISTYESMATLERSFWNIFTLWFDCFNWLCLCWIFSSGYWLQKRQRVRMISHDHHMVSRILKSQSLIVLVQENNNICTFGLIRQTRYWKFEICETYIAFQELKVSNLNV